MLNKIIALLLTSFITACSVMPEKNSTKDMVSFGNKAVYGFYNIQDKPNYTMDIYEVSARVLKYNIGRKLRQLEIDLSEARLNEYKAKLLPKLNVGINVKNRNNNNIRQEIAVGSNSTIGTSFTNDGVVVSDKSITSTGLELSWNVLDFGISYFAAHQKADAVLIARERRRKAIFKLLEQSHAAYWKIVSGQRNQRLVLNILTNIDRALALISSSTTNNLSQATLIKKRDLLKYRKQVNNFLRDINKQKMELASLMGLPAGTSFTVYAHNEKLPVINLSTGQMDEFLFANHPDMRIAAYNEQISLAQSKIALYSLFPNLSIGTGLATTSDSYQKNKSYTYAGAALSYNLMNVFNISSRNNMNDIEKLFAENSRIASGVAVLTSARIRELLYQDAMSSYADDVNLHMIEKQLSKTTRSNNPRDVSGYTKLVKIQIGELEAGLTRANSYSKLARFALSIGSVLNPSEFDYDLNQIELSTLKHSLKLELGRMPVSWLRQNDKYSIPSKILTKQVSKVFKLWRLEKFRGVKEGGDNKFIPNNLPSSALDKYVKPILKPIGDKKPLLKKNKPRKPVIKLIKPSLKAKQPVSVPSPVAPVKTSKPVVRKLSAPTSNKKQPGNALNEDIYNLLEKMETTLEGI